MKVNLSLAVVLAVLIGLHWAVPSDPTRRSIRYFPDMADSIAMESQAPPVADTTIDLRPPEGSIARGFLPFNYDATPEDAVRAGLELVNPLAADDSGVGERGAALFATFCTPCHGPNGNGDGPVTLKGVPPPPSLHLPHALDLPDGQIYHIITHGQKNMGSYAAQVDRLDRWRLVGTVRSLQQAEIRRVDAATAAAAAAAAQTEAAEPEPDESAGAEVHS
ncbi:MAG: cytochrome c [Acidobacteria bacterium]|nr:MAG: cytochrome c [Acidobacteriota bacterium]